MLGALVAASKGFRVTELNYLQPRWFVVVQFLVNDLAAEQGRWHRLLRNRGVIRGWSFSRLKKLLLDEAN
jgi:hypothetical protein